MCVYVYMLHELVYLHRMTTLAAACICMVVTLTTSMCGFSMLISTVIVVAAVVTITMNTTFFVHFINHTL